MIRLTDTEGRALKITASAIAAVRSAGADPRKGPSIVHLTGGSWFEVREPSADIERIRWDVLHAPAPRPDLGDPVA